MDLGFKENDALIYLAALELGECTVGQLVKKTGLHKQIIYNAALSLQHKGFFNIGEANNQRIFIPLSPELIVLKEKDNLRRAEDLSLELKKIAGTVKPAENVRIFNGLAGIKQYYLEIVEKMPMGSVLRIIGISSKRYFEIFPPGSETFNAFEEMRIGKRIQIELIAFGKKDEEVLLNKGRRFLEIRWLKDEVWSPNDLVISSDRVGLLLFVQTPYLLDLPGKDIVQGFIEYFKFFWNRGETCYKD